MMEEDHHVVVSQCDQCGVSFPAGSGFYVDPINHEELRKRLCVRSLTKIRGECFCDYTCLSLRAYTYYERYHST